jgi:hypothetical protein
MVSQENAFMISAPLDRWANDVFLPVIDRCRFEFRCLRQAELLTDRAHAHCTCAFLEKWKEKGVDGVFFIPDPSDQCYPLDLLIFSLLKKWRRYKKLVRLSSIDTPLFCEYSIFQA